MVTIRILAACTSALILALPAGAAGGGGHDSNSGPSNHIRASFTVEPDLEDGGADGYGEAGELGPRGVIIPTLTMPSFVDGELHGYIFVDVRLTVIEGVDPWRVRARAHLIRDALIRAGHRESITLAEDPTRLDTERAREILREGMAGVVDLNEIERLEFINVDSHAG